MQRGRIYEASGKFYVQYRAGGKQVSKCLCAKSPAYYSKTCKAVKLKAAEIMLEINRSAAVAPPMADMTIVEFWENRFLPYCEEIRAVNGRPRLKPETVRGYKQIWKQHLKAHFGDRTLQQYEARFGTAFLQSLTSKWNKTTLRHISALASTIFRYAVIEQRLRSNPWKDVVSPADAVDAPTTPHYTWDEAEDVISAMVDRVDCQLIMALACFLGLRPNEIAPLRWEDCDGEWLHIRRGYVRGKLDVPKTPESMAPVPVILQVRIPLELWRQKCGNPTEGWLFPSDGTLPETRIIAPELKHLTGGRSPVDLHNLISRVIMPAVKAKGLVWKPLKAGRTGACTAVIEKSNGNYALAQALLRHKSMKTTLDIYKKQITPEAFKNGMKLLEGATEAK